MYKIKYSYKTGDSFGNEDRESLLEYEWEDLDVAKEALRRIKEHYVWYESIAHPYYVNDSVKPEWHNIKEGNIAKDMIHYMLNIPADNGEEYQFWAPWCGYFETLYGAEIVVVDEKDMGFTLH